MTPTIRVDEEVFAALQERALPLVDSPNSVLRRVFELDGAEPPHRGARPRSSGRAHSSELLPHSAYRPEVLKALADRGGSAHAREVIKTVGEALADQLTTRDRELNKSGAVRWENRVQWQRQRLKEEGLIKDSASRGTWELTPAGMAEAAKLVKN
jgi:alkylated DNA nucleotide flippase Atl1